MRAALVIAIMAASPATACGFDGMFGFNHYSDMAPDAAAADAMREAAIADARDKFMAQHGLVQVADSQTSDTQTSDTQDTVAAPLGMAMAANATEALPE